MNKPTKRNRFKDAMWSFHGYNWVRKLPSTPPFESIRRCVIFTGLHLYQQQQRSIDRFCDDLRERGYKVLEVVLYPTRDPKMISAIQSPDKLHLCLKDQMFWGFPKKPIQEKFRDFQSDLFINLNAEFSYSDIGFGLASLSSYRISSYQAEYKPYFNILLKGHSENDLESYISQIKELFAHLK
jgi:hypothetical protein